MSNKQLEEKIYLAKIRDDYGSKIIKTLEITMDEDDIYFVRNKDGVAAWHCGSLPKTDHRILEITEKPNE